jgi:hypothetical protein
MAKTLGEANTMAKSRSEGKKASQAWLYYETVDGDMLGR